MPSIQVRNYGLVSLGNATAIMSSFQAAREANDPQDLDKVIKRAAVVSPVPFVCMNRAAVVRFWPFA